MFFKKNSYLIFVFIIFFSTNIYARPLVIVSSINPIYQIAKFISGDENKNFLLVKPNISEHHYMPKPSDIKAISQADAIFYISDDLEYYLPKILKSTANKAAIIKLIDIPNLKLLKIKTSKAGENYITDPHIWLDLDNAKILAEVISKNLSTLDPENKNKYFSNLKKFISEIDDADKKIKNNLKELKSANYMVYHNGYQYFENYYGLNSTKIIPYFYSTELSIFDVKKINDEIQKNNIKCIITSAQEENNTAAGIANFNHIKLIVADLIGSLNYKNSNGYLELIDNLSIQFSSCININNFDK